MGRKKHEPRRLESIQRHNALLEERSARSAAATRGGGLASLRFDEDEDEEVERAGGFWRGQRDALSGLDDMDASSIGGDDVEEGDESDDDDDRRVMKSSSQNGPTEGTPLGKRRQGAISTRTKPSSGKRRRKRLFREGRRIELGGDDDDDEEDEVVDMESFMPTIQVPIADPSVKELLLRRMCFELPEDNLVNGGDLAVWIYRSSDTERRRLQITPQDDVQALLLQKDAAEAFGLDSEGLDCLLWLFERKPSLAYYEAVIGSDRTLQLSIFLTAAALHLASPTNVPPPTTVAAKHLRQLMEAFYPHMVPEAFDRTKVAMKKVAAFNPVELYNVLEEYKQSHLSGRKGKGKARRLPELKLKLRTYQEDALEWMVSRERGVESPRGKTAAELPHGWIALKDGDGAPLFYNYVTVALSREAPEPWSSSGIKGGILADEMGLGKTIEVLSLVLSNRWDQTEVVMEEEEEEADDREVVIIENICPCGRNTNRAAQWVQCNKCSYWVHLQCAGFATQEEADNAPTYTCEVCHGLRRFRAPRQVGATLIVCPQLILSQWVEEIANHSIGVKVVVYPGVRNIHTPLERRLLNPDYLGGFDVVLTTFDVLNNELGHTDNVFVLGDNESIRSKLRRDKRYRVVPSPLASMVWWRICLDEAQMVEASATSAAQMALRLQTVHRWCVSGTPISKGQLEDLYGLMLFLGAKPYDSRSWWKHAIELPYLSGSPEASTRLHTLLSGLMWRTSKKSVKDQLALPPQTEVTRKLVFSKVEQHFYAKQHEACEATVKDAIRRAKSDGKTDASHALQKCAAPLLRLRQACCHPQIGAGGIRASRIMTMDEIHHKLLEDCKHNCEETQRLLILNLSGLAGVARIQAQVAQDKAQEQNYERFLTEAGRFYEKALTLAEDNRKPTVIPHAALVEMAGNRDLFHKHLAGQEQGEVAVGASSDMITMAWKPITREHLEGPSQEVPWWARIVFSTGKRVSGMRIQCAADSTLQPRQCRLLASNSAEGYVFMEVATFDVQALPLLNDGEAADGTRELRGVIMHSAKVWKLEVLSVDKRGGQDHQHQQQLLHLQVEIMAAEIDVDLLQILHLTSNFAEVLAEKMGTDAAAASLSSSSSSTVEMDKITEFKQLQGQPMGPKIAWLRSKADLVKKREAHICVQLHRLNRLQVNRTESAVKAHEDELKTYRSQRGADKTSGVAWWEWLLVQLERAPSPSSATLLERCRNEVLKTGFMGFTTFNGLLLALKKRLDDILDDRKKILKKIKNLSESPSDAEVAENGNCQTCRADWKKTGPVCRHCRLGNEINQYYEELFSFSEQGGVESGGAFEDYGGSRVVRERQNGFVALGGEAKEPRRAFRNPSEVFRVLYLILLKFLRQEAGKRKHDVMWQQMAEEATKDKEVHTLLEAERTAIQAMWNAHQNLLSVVDELGTATIRVRLALPDETPATVTDEMRNMVIFEGEELTRRNEYYTQSVVYEDTLKNQKAQLAFLRNMATGKEQQGETSSEDCAICLSSMEGAPVMVLPCAHYFCEPCVRNLLKGQRNKCPTCRRVFTKPEVTKSHNVAKAARERKEADEEMERRRGEEEEEEEAEKEGERGGTSAEEEIDVSAVIGSWGTKVTALVADLQNLPSDDKCLVFSEWDEMLDVVQAALNANKVGCVRLKGTGRRADEIRGAFKQKADLRCLLLNLKSGGKGLTLVEANHVFLLEPLFNAATEAQAINRIHRIGQTKPTFVHRLVVRNTIEEKVEAMRRRSLAAAGGEDSVLSSVKKSKQHAEAEVTLDDYASLFDWGKRGEEESVSKAAQAVGRRRLLDVEDEVVEIDGDDRVGVDSRSPAGGRTERNGRRSGVLRGRSSGIGRRGRGGATSRG